MVSTVLLVANSYLLLLAAVPLLILVPILAVIPHQIARGRISQRSAYVTILGVFGMALAVLIAAWVAAGRLQ